MKLAQGKKMRVISQEELKENVHYDPLTGVFIWIISNSSCVKIGNVAGGLKNDGYIHIGINGKQYLAHRLAWLYMTGEMPKEDIDHKNGIKSDNWFDNLRQATHKQNQQNRTKPQSNNTTGYLGVIFFKQTGKYAAQISINGKLKYLGYFHTPEEAHEAYLTEKRKRHAFCTI